MPSITTIATSPIPGRGLNRGPRTNVPSAPPPPTYSTATTMSAGYGFWDDPTIWSDSEKMEPANGLPNTGAYVFLTGDVQVIVPTNKFRAGIIDLNGYNLNFIGHPLTYPEGVDPADDQWYIPPNDGPPTSCPDAVVVVLPQIYDTAIPAGEGVTVDGHVELIQWIAPDEEGGGGGE